MSYNLNDVNSWPGFKPLIIAHDLGRSRDRSTAVVGGNNPCGRRVLPVGKAVGPPRTVISPRRLARSWRMSMIA